MLKFKQGFVFIVPLIIALLIVGGGMYGVYTIFGDKSSKATPTKSPSPPSVNNPFPQASPSPVNNNLPERQMTPNDDGGPIKTSSNISGKWVGRYTVNSPEACKGESGAWTANLVDNNGSLSGSFESDAGGGSISGSGANWSVGGGGGDISFKGSISGNTTSGSFTGEVCDPEEAPQKTSGSFFGGK